MIVSLNITVKPECRSTLDRVDLAATVRKLLPDCGLIRAMQHASLLLSGAPLTISQFEADQQALRDSRVIFDVEQKLIMSPQEEREAALERERQLRNERFQRLLELGARGDAIAAITYCKAELAGEVTHAAYAGACG